MCKYGTQIIYYRFSYHMFKLLLYNIFCFALMLNILSVPRVKSIVLYCTLSLNQQRVFFKYVTYIKHFSLVYYWYAV